MKRGSRSESVIVSLALYLWCGTILWMEEIRLSPVNEITPDNHPFLYWLAVILTFIFGFYYMIKSIKK